MEWELSKENVQPMKSGHRVEILNESLKAKAEGRSCSNRLEDQRRQLLEAIEQYSGNDPLEPWIRCIKWTKDAYPVVGPQSELVKLLDGCTREFQKDERYRNDVRYLRVWVQYADCCTDPTDVFAFLEANDIGQTHSLFYIAYATSMEVRKNFAKAQEIYKLGMARKAEPLGRLKTMCKSFIVRMMRREERQLREEQERMMNGPTADMEHQARSFGPNADYLEAQNGRNRGRQAAAAAPPPISRSNKSMSTKIAVFVDPEFDVSRNASTHNNNAEDSGPSSRPKVAWYNLPGEGDRRKENTQQPTKWTEAKIKQSIPLSDSRHSTLDIFVDEEFSELKDQPKPAKAAPPPVMKLRLEDIQSVKRTSPRVKGSFLERSSTALDSATRSSGIPGFAIGPAPAHETRILVMAYDAGMLVGDDGAEKCFEEARLDVWVNSHQVLPDPGPADATERLRDEELHEARVVVLEAEETVLLEERNATGTSLSPSSPPTASLVVETHTTEVKDTIGDSGSHDDIVAQSDENRTVKNDTYRDTSDASEHASPLTGGGSSKLIEQDCQREPLEGIPPVASCSSNPPFSSPSFCTQGDETIAIKRVADEIIVLGADSFANGIDAVSHQGLVEPTINTKECVADILDMFNKPLESDKARRSTRVPRDSKKSSSSFGGFEVYIDEDLQEQGSQERGKDKKGSTASSSTFGDVGRGQVGGFEVFVDENLGSERTARSSSKWEDKSSSATCNKSQAPKGGSFQVFQDENFAMPPRPKQNKKKTSAGQSKAFDVFVDDDFCDTITPQTEKDVAVSAPSPRESVGSVGRKSTQKIYEDESMELIPSKPRKTQAEAMTASGWPTTLGVYVDEDFRDSSRMELLSCQQDVCKSSQQRLFPAQDKENIVSLQVDDHVKAPESTGEAKYPQENSFERNMEAYLDPVERPGQVDQTSSAHVTDIALMNHVTLELVEEVPHTAPVSLKVDPWDETTQKDLLSKVQISLPSYEGYFEHKGNYSGPLPMSCLRASHGGRNKVIELDKCTYRITRCVGEGAFAHVFEAEDEEDDYYADPRKIALKFQRQACPWEFYMYRQLDKRIPNDERRYYGYVRRLHLFTDCSFIICDYGERGTLQDVINAYLATNQHMPEAVCMFYTIEMLRMLEVLHSVGIIHGDIKPDNLLIRDYDDSVGLEEWNPERRGSWKSEGLCLIDWGRSIDLTLFPDGTMFNGDCKTDSFRCPEMLEKRPWKFQVDTFGLSGVVHCLLYGSYMQLEKVKNAEGQTLYRPRTALRRYWNVNLWKELFDTLLNVKDFGDTSVLSQLRDKFERYLYDTGLGKKLKEQLNKQNIMVYTSNRR